ncbi:MAG: hypothetical protein ACKKL5_03090 [Candidatus Komeilibacteria bacterium]
MKYTLKDIELWSYSGSSLPILENNPKIVGYYLGNKYNTKEFRFIIKKIIHELEKNNWIVCSTMNPYYPDKGHTVINIDITKNPKLLQMIGPKKQSSNQNNKLNSIIKKHEKLSELLFEKSNVNIKYIKIDGMLFSQNRQLYKIEKKINQIMEDTDNNLLNRDNENNYTYEELYAMSWVKKDSILFKKLLKNLTTGSEKEKNIILLQLIPLVTNLPNTEKSKLFDILSSDILRYPSSTLRNKALAILSLLTNSLKLLNNEHLALLEIISKSSQINSSCPAKIILKKRKRI